MGRSYRDAPEVDGELLLPKKKNKLEIGEFYNVRVTDYNEYDLFGKIFI
ncbi:MAG: hypothetical protein P8X73_10305 [Ignavibacteriaceae bacterium]